MARSLEQISADFDKLTAASTQIDDDLKSLYQEYLTTLGQAVQRQLVLAAYHLCTQAYPDDFLTLSVSQREKVQSGIRQIAEQGRTQILQLSQVTDVSNLASRLQEVISAQAADEADASDDALSAPSETVITAEMAAAIDASAAGPTDALDFQDDSDAADKTDASEGNEETEASSSDPDSASVDAQEVTDETAAIADASQEAAEMIQQLNTSLSLFSILEAEPVTPVSLAKRHVLIERHLRVILRTLSSLSNQLLKQADILPDLPEMVIAAASEAEGGETGPTTPNVLNVLVEMGGDRSDPDPETDEDDVDDDLFETEDSERAMTHLVAINLRLADIEFADPHVALWRGRMQETLHKLKRVGSRYQKLQQEKSRAEAEHAWRAIWFEE